MCQDEPECGTLRLSSLSPAPGSVAELHLALTNTFAHLFVMKMDWLLARGLPCLGLARTWSLTRLHIRSIHTPQYSHFITENYLKGESPHSIAAVEQHISTTFFRVYIKYKYNAQYSI